MGMKWVVRGEGGGEKGRARMWAAGGESEGAGQQSPCWEQKKWEDQCILGSRERQLKGKGPEEKKKMIQEVWVRQACH